MYAKHNSESNSTHVEMLKLCSRAMNNEEEHNTFIGVKKQQISGSSTMTASWKISWKTVLAHLGIHVS